MNYKHKIEFTRVCAWCNTVMSGEHKGKTEQAAYADDPSLIFTHGICAKCKKIVDKEIAELKALGVK